MFLLGYRQRSSPLEEYCRRFVAVKMEAYLLNSYTSLQEQEKGLLIIGIFAVSRMPTNLRPYVSKYMPGA